MVAKRSPAQQESRVAMELDEQPSSPLPIDDDERTAEANGNADDGLGVNSPRGTLIFMAAAVVVAIVAGYVFG